MSFDSDIALIGTGVAPLVAASQLMAQGKSVLILNPDLDFFLENSELAIDPLWPNGHKLSMDRVRNSAPDRALEVLRPEFPGAVELWAEGLKRAEGYRDWQAPHARARDRLWMSASEASPTGYDWEALEELYVDASDAGLNPQILEGLAAAKRFPGYSQGIGEYRALLIPKLVDVDVIRYRNGLLEFVRERLGPERVICEAAQLQLIPEGVRFHAAGGPRTARVRDGVLVFWTPRLSSWVTAQAKRSEVASREPRGIRLWEEWSLISREALDPCMVGVFENMTVWAEIEGAPDAPGALPGSEPRLAVLMPGKEPSAGSSRSVSWASSESFASLYRLCHDFLRWEKFSVREMRPRAILEWGNAAPWPLSQGVLRASVVPACDGYLVDVVRNARAACDRLLREAEVPA